MTGKPETPLPVAGGSYIRNTATGALEIAPSEPAPDAPAKADEKPAPKSTKQPVKEA